jgi:hypothetical protein
MGFHSLVNTAYFSEAATDFKKNGGKYITAPIGSRDYFQYWEEQENRCLYGYSVGDLWIPGRMYFWLNFFPIYKVPDHVIAKAIATGKIPANVEKEQSFAKFWEIHYEWWNYKHIAWYGGEFMGVESPGGKHIGCLKTRGAGFSYMEACDGCYNYNFIDGSKSYYFAGAEPYLIGDAIMDKVKEGLDWINIHCPYWKKNRQVKNSPMHYRASYKDEYDVERGTKSEIIAQTVDNPNKTRGKRGRKASFEEGGSFPKLENALEICLGSMRDGSVYVGQVSVFGTGGEEGPGIQGLENIFNTPEAWDMLAFPNIWEEGFDSTECGYFVPCWRANSWYMDKDGNVDMEGAIKDDDIARAKKEKSKKPKDLDRRKAEYPRTPSEALQRLTGNGFNIAEIDAQIRKIQTDKAIQGLLRHGKLIRSSSSSAINGVEFQILPKNKARPIEDYPHEQGDDLTGCVTIVQRPYQDQKGNVPAGMYAISFDSYYKEQSDDLTSLFSIKVWKIDNPIDSSYAGIPVAWYAGRTKDLEDSISILFMLCDMYNGKAQGEISGGGQAVVTYAKTHRYLHRLENEPEMAHNKAIASKSAGNSYLMNMSTDRKKLGITYLEDWHTKPRSLDEHGRLILTIHRVYDIAFLKEMRKFNPDKGNFDRISDAMIQMFMQKEHYVKSRRQRRKQKSFYKRKLFDSPYSSGVTESY